MKKHRLAKRLGLLMTMAFMVSAGAVGCCPWVGPTPGGPLPGGELQLVLVAQPDMVPPGGCTMLHWEVSPPGEYRVLLNGQEVPLVGEQQVCPPGTTTYELLVETPGGPQVRTVTVNVGGGPGGAPQPPTSGGGPGQPPTPGMGPPPTGGPGEGCAGAPTFTYFTASPSSISVGQQVQLSWGEVRNGTSGPLVGSVVLSPGGFGEVGSPGSRWASPTTTTIYRLTATGCGGTATKDVTVTVGGGGAVATSTPHPGGPTATTQGPTATKQAAGPTATPTLFIIATFIAVPAPTCTAHGDLVLDDVDLGTDGELYLRVSNTSGSLSGSFGYQVALTVSSVGAVIMKSGSFTIPTGGEAFWTGYKPMSGETLKITIDSSGSICETNENNNSMTRTF